MARQPGLVRRGTRWYLRARVPADLVEVLGRVEVWRSLRTGDHARALRLYRVARVELDDQFDRVRRARRGLPTGDEARRVVAGWLRDRDRANAERDMALRGEGLHDALREVESYLHHLRDGDDEVAPSVQAATDRILIGAGFPARQHRVGPIGTSTVVADVPERPEQLQGLVHRALVEESRRRLDRLQGRPAREVDPALDASTCTARGITLDELVGRFYAERRGRVNDRKRVEYERLFVLLREVWGPDVRVRTLDREACRRVRDVVAALPSNAGKRWPGRSLVAVAERARERGVEPMSPTTANAYLSKLSTLLRWAVREEYVDRNPAEGLRVDEPEGDPVEARLPFSVDQLRMIFGRDFQSLEGARRWVPLLSLFGGLRLGECCQLRTEDVVEDDGVHLIVVRPEAGRLKTVGARRAVPVHPELVRLGLLKYVEQVRHERLFPELGRDSHGGRADPLGKWFGRYLAGVGAKTPRHVFHSLRHNFTDALRETGASPDVVDAVMGWRRPDMRSRYGSGYRPSTLAAAVEAVRYEGLDLRHLRVR